VRDRYALLAFETLASRRGATPAGEYGPPDDGWAGALCDALAASDTGRSAAPEAVRPRLDLPWHHPDRMHPDRPDWWRHHESAFADALAAVGVPRRRADAVAREVRAAYLDPDAWAAVAGVPAALDRLDAAGWQPVVYLNGPPEVDHLLELVGLDGRVTRAFASATTGYELPHARAFETVEDALGDGRFWFAGRDSAGVEGSLDVGIPGVLVGDEGDVPPGGRSVSGLSGLADLLDGK
jgi:phosphoglycolate phosphatase-like HAD superfamily hydrolase